MGATASLSDKIYKPVKCGCIYSFSKSLQKLELPFCCYECLEIIKERDYNKIHNILLLETSNLDKLSEKGWKNIHDAIIYANNNNILLEEFLENSDILNLYNYNLFNNKIFFLLTIIINEPSF